MSQVTDFQNTIIAPVNAVLTYTVNATTSAAAFFAGAKAKALIVPAGLSGTTLTFLASIDGVNFYPLTIDAGTLFTLTVSTAAAIFPLPSDTFEGLQYLKVVVASQSADFTFTFIPYCF